MGIREKMNNNPALTGVAILVLVAVGGYFSWRAMQGESRPEIPRYYYYTTDEGKSTFSVSADEVAPIMKDGKEAVLCRIYSCDGGKTTFVAYLQKYTEDFKKKADAERGKTADPNAKGPSNSIRQSPAEAFARLVKKPGDKNWVGMTQPAGQEIIAVSCPSGNIEDLTEKLP